MVFLVSIVRGCGELLLNGQTCKLSPGLLYSDQMLRCFSGFRFHLSFAAVLSKLARLAHEIPFVTAGRQSWQQLIGSARKFAVILSVVTVALGHFDAFF